MASSIKLPYTGRLTLQQWARPTEINEYNYIVANNQTDQVMDRLLPMERARSIHIAPYGQITGEDPIERYMNNIIAEKFNKYIPLENTQIVFEPYNSYLDIREIIPFLLKTHVYELTLLSK